MGKAGFSLIEVLVALVLLAGCLLVLQPLGGLMGHSGQTQRSLVVQLALQGLAEQIKAEWHNPQTFRDNCWQGGQLPQGWTLRVWVQDLDKSGQALKPQQPLGVCGQSQPSESWFKRVHLQALRQEQVHHEWVLDLARPR